MALASFSPYGSHKVFSPFAFNSLYPMQRNTDLYRRVRTEILAKWFRLVVKKTCFLQKSMKLLIKREPETEYIPTSHFPTWETFKHQYAYMISLYLKKKKKSWMIFFRAPREHQHNCQRNSSGSLEQHRQLCTSYKHKWSEKCCYSSSTKQLLCNCALAHFKLHDQMEFCFSYDYMMTKTSNSFLVF